MSTCVTLPFWPGKIDCMRWSTDNLLAVAGSESVAILTPKLKSRPNDVAGWEFAVIRINTFTARELPLIDPLSFANWSVGEEISPRHVQSMDWSQPGLGSMGSCILAILHSDFVLDLWEYHGRPNAKENWKRCLLITTTVRDHYKRTRSEAVGETHQVAGRVRSMAWAPRPNLRTYGLSQQMLAVATEAGDILLIEITSPYDILNPTQSQWTARVKHTISCSSYFPSLDLSLHNRSSPVDSYALIEDLIWQSSDQGQHQFAFLFAGMLHQASWTAEGQATFRQITTPGARIEPPLRLTPDSSALVCVVDDSLVLQPLSTTSIQATVWSLDREWSDVAGIAMISQQSGAFQACPALHLGYDRQEVRVVKSSHATNTSPSGLQNTLLNDMQTYAHKLELGGGVIAHTWGIDASPSGREIACCCTMLPADSIAHVIQSDQYSNVYISKTAPIDAEGFTGDRDTSESIVFALQSHIDTARKEQDDPDSIQQQVEATLHLYMRSFSSGNQSPNPVLQSLTSDVILRKDRLDDMEQRLLALAYNKEYSSFMPKSWYLALIQCYQERFDKAAKGKLSARILALYETAQLALLQNESIHSSTAEDACGICGEKMIFEAIRWARCSSGHRFTRCALTFMAILQPGTSKFCSVCNAQYLYEQRLPELGVVGSGDNVEPSKSPARMLFAAFQRCILCNGRFTT